MTDYERDMAAGGKPVMSDYERDMAAGGKPVQAAAPQADPFAGPSHDIPMGVAAPPPEPPSRLDSFLSAVGLKGHDWIPSGEPYTPSSKEHQEGVQYAQHPDKLRQDAGPLADDWIAQNIVAGIPAAGAGRIVGAAAKALTPARIGSAAPVISRVAGGAAEGATASTLQGGSPVAGGVIGALIPAAGAGFKGAAGKLRGKLRDPHGEIGRTLATLDEAKASGVMKTPEFKALPKGAEGFNQAATVAEEGLAQHNLDKLAGARKDYGKQIDSILADHGDRLHLVTETEGLVGQLEADNMVNGEVVNDHLAKALGKVRRMLTMDTGELDANATRANIAKGDMSPEMVTAPAVPVADLMKVRRAVGELADYDSPATPETRPYRLLDKSLRRDLEGIDPRIGEINKSYAKTMGELEESNDILYGSQHPDIVRNTAKQKRARGLLGRVGDTTQPATLARADIERLKAIDPRYRDIIAPVEAKKAVERSKFGIPTVSHRIERIPFSVLTQNATALGVHVADPVLSALQTVGDAPRGALPLLTRAREEQRRIESQRSAAFGGR